MLLDKLGKLNLIHPPKFIYANTAYLTIMGSSAYGVSSDSSDLDIYGFCIPPKDLIFPHIAGEIPGFGRQIQKFEQFQQHGIKSPDSDVEYDFSIFSIVKYFQLCMENNPNTLDSLFTPRNCIIHSTAISEHVRENRKIFLHKGAYYKFRGYAYSQMSKIKNKTNSSNPKRAELIEKFGYDTKFAYHILRLALEAEQIMVTHDLDLQRDRDLLKSVRRGEWTLDRIEQWFQNKEKTLDQLFASSTLPHSPDETAIKALLLESLEMHYGSMSDCIKIQTNIEQLIAELNNVIGKYS